MPLLQPKQINTLVPSQNDIIYVSAGGDDVLNDGSILRPYATIAKAMASVPDASVQRAIKVGPGSYAANIALKPNVFIVGESSSETALTGNVTLDPSWAANPGSISGLQSIQWQVAGAQALDFSAQNANGNLVFSDVLLAGSGAPSLAFTAADNTSTLTLKEVRISALPITIKGFASRLLNSTLRTATSTLLVTSSAVAVPATLDAIGGGTEANVTIQTTLNGLASANLVGFALKTSLTIDNGAVVSATAESIPAPTGPTFVNGASQAQLSYLTYAPASGYNPTTPANWTVIGPGLIPINVQQALDDLAAGLSTVTAGISWKNPAQTISFNAIPSPPSNATTPLGTLINGFGTEAGARIILTGQGNPIENGIWVVPAGAAAAWTRAADLPVGDTALGAAAFIEGVGAGNTLSNSVGNAYVQNLQGPGAPPHPVVGTDPLNFVQFGAASTGSVPQASGKHLAATATPAIAANYLQATASTLPTTSAGYVGVLLNGLQQYVATVGGLTGAARDPFDCYFSSDGGVTTLANGGGTNVAAGATLYWNAVTNGVRLAATDVFDFDFNS